MPFHAKKILHLRPTYELVISQTLFSLGYAVAIVGVPLYLIHIGLQDSQIGIFTGIIALMMAAVSFYLPPILEKYNQRKTLIYSAFFASACFVAFGLTGSAVLAILLLACAQVSLHVNSSALIVLFKDSTRTMQEFTKNTGLLGSFENFGWFIGPVLGGLALSVFGFKGLFIVAGSLTSLGGLYVLLFPFRTVIKKREKLDGNVKANIRYYLSQPHLRLAYIQKLGVDLWWGLIWTFVPIFMLKAGYSGAAIGIFIALTQLPLFLFEFKTVDFIKKYGFKRIFAACYLSLTLICVLSLLAMPSYFVVALGLILLGSLALSFLEPITDIFFFSKLSLLEEEKAYPTYSTASPIGDTVAKILPGVALIFFADKVAFLVIGAMMLLIARKAMQVRN